MKDISYKYLRSDKEVLTESFSDVVEFIANNFLPIKQKHINHNIESSYSIKHHIENYLGSYVNNLDVKVAFALLDIEGIELKYGSPNMIYPLNKRKYTKIINKLEQQNRLS